jgi:hypothetical protein
MNEGKMSKKIYSLLLLFLLFFNSIYSTELRPWFGPNLLILWRTEYTYQHYSKINSDKQTISKTADDSFLNLSLELSPDPTLDFEVEALLSDTRKRGKGFDCGRITGRYQLMDDILGDPMTLTAGITLTRANHISLHDISSFHHGIMEYEAHLSAGKEFSCEKFWTSRFWGLIGLAVADRGSPWMRIHLAYERNFWDYADYGIFLRGLFGFGDHNIQFINPFPGYGVIQHRSIEIGGYYRHFIQSFGAHIYGQYAYRVWAHNFPAQTSLLTLGIEIPLSP